MELSEEQDRNLWDEHPTDRVFMLPGVYDLESRPCLSLKIEPLLTQDVILWMAILSESDAVDRF